MTFATIISWTILLIIRCTQYTRVVYNLPSVIVKQITHHTIIFDYIHLHIIHAITAENKLINKHNGIRYPYRSILVLAK